MDDAPEDERAVTASNEGSTPAAMDTPPRRRLELSLTIGADTLEDLHDALQQFATDLLIDNREEHIRASGGWRSGYSSTLTVDPEMTGDRYRREVQEWHKSPRAFAKEADHV